MSGSEPEVRTWKVVLALHGPPDVVQSRLLVARIQGVSWYRRHGELHASVRVDAPTLEAAVETASTRLGEIQVRTTVVKAAELGQ